MSIQDEIIASILPGVSEKDYGHKYREHLLEQYKIYLQLADKISDRRSITNTFFLAANTGLVSAIGISNLRLQNSPPLLLVVVGVAVGLFCYSWYRVIRSYRDINTAKF